MQHRFYKYRIAILIVTIFFVTFVTVTHRQLEKHFQELQLCDFQNIRNTENLILLKIFKNQEQDEFFWNYFLKIEYSNVTNQLQKLNLDSELAVPLNVESQCESMESDLASSLVKLYKSERRDLVWQFLRQAQALRNSAKKMVVDLRIEKDSVMTKIRDDLKRYAYHVRQSNLSNRPKMILHQKCQITLAGLSDRKAKTCRKAIQLAKISDERDLENLMANRNLLFKKWNTYKVWLEKEAQKIDKALEDPA